MQNDEKRIAVFIDFENVAMGVRESKYGNFDVDLVLKRLVEKGKIMVKRAYSDWHRYAEFKRAFHQAAIELIDVPQTRYSGKNSADIRMVVDALDLSYQKEHIDTFVLVSGDSDFSPLVSKLRENGRYVIGMGVKQSSSDLLVNNCDEFIYYEDLVRPTTGGRASDPRLLNLPEKKAEAMRLVMETFEALQREGKESIYGSMVKQTLIRKLPSFNESYYGYPTFSRLLEDAAENRLLKLTKDQRSGGYIITGTTEAGVQSAVVPASGEGTAEAAGVESSPPTPTPATGSAEIRDFQRRSRWGRNRWGRGSLRPSPTAAPLREVPSQNESSTATAKDQESSSAVNIDVVGSLPAVEVTSQLTPDSPPLAVQETTSPPMVETSAETMAQTQGLHSRGGQGRRKGGRGAGAYNTHTRRSTSPVAASEASASSQAALERQPEETARQLEPQVTAPLQETQPKIAKAAGDSHNSQEISNVAGNEQPASAPASRQPVRRTAARTSKPRRESRRR
jgi:uncharacterized protein (TIGR00288 family)